MNSKIEQFSLLINASWPSAVMGINEYLNVGWKVVSITPCATNETAYFLVILERTVIV